LAAVDVVSAAVSLKWPNDVMLGTEKVGGILSESSDGVTVVGFGLNLWWRDPPPGASGLLVTDPGADHGPALAERWAVSLLHRLDSDHHEWGRDEYRERCSTIGRSIVWAPSGAGRAVDVGRDGALVVEVDGGVVELSSGAVREVRSG
jgi:BirA family biotin operon repressor/biotin-[acetyl-CoA-carboxylase] ligase